MSHKPKRPGVVPTMPKPDGTQPDQEPLELPTEMPMELLVHSSNIQIGETPDGQIVFSLLTPVGIKITIPFAKDAWLGICRASLAPHVAVAPAGWKPPMAAP